MRSGADGFDQVGELELISFHHFLQAESGNVVKVDTFFFAITRLRTNRTKWLVLDFARTIFSLFLSLI